MIPPATHGLHDSAILSATGQGAEAQIADGRLPDRDSFDAGARRCDGEGIASVGNSRRVEVVLVIVRGSAGDYAVDLAIDF